MAQIIIKNGEISSSAGINMPSSLTVSGNVIIGTIEDLFDTFTVNSQANFNDSLSGTTAQFTTVTGSSVIGTNSIFNTYEAGIGSVSLPSYNFGGDNTGIYRPATNQVAVSTNGAEAVRFVNQTSGSQIQMSSLGGNASLPTLTWYTNTNTGIFKPLDNIIGFSTNASERMRITDTQTLISGNLAITGSGLISGSTAQFTTITGSLLSGTTAQFGAISSIRGVATTFPSSQGAALTRLRNNGAGTLTWSANAVFTTTSTATPTTFDASSYERVTWIASFGGNITAEISNLTDGREMFLYVRNTSPAGARTLTINASATASGFAAVNCSRSGAASVSSISLAANSGTATIWVANIGGNIVGAIY